MELEFRSIKCRSCNVWNPPMSKTCQGCGNDLSIAACLDLFGPSIFGVPSVKKCNSCATWNDKETQYCRNCGIDFSKQQ